MLGLNMTHRLSVGNNDLVTISFQDDILGSPQLKASIVHRYWTCTPMNWKHRILIPDKRALLCVLAEGQVNLIESSPKCKANKRNLPSFWDSQAGTPR